MEVTGSNPASPPKNVCTCQVPILGTMIPNMGTSLKNERCGIADALFSATQQRVLALIYGQPGRSFFTTELINLVGAGRGAVQRELRRLVESGLVTVSAIGNQKHYQANTSASIYKELHGIVVKTLGIAEQLKSAVEPIKDEMLLAFIYGSVASNKVKVGSDVDLLVVSDTLTLEDIYSVVENFEGKFSLRVNPTLYKGAEYKRRKTAKNPFLTKLLNGPVVWIVGDSIEH